MMRFALSVAAALPGLVRCAHALADPPASQPAVAQRATTAPAAPSAPLPGPRYMALRYDDDFSYLDGPDGTYQKDFFDPIKNIRLDDDWRLRIGGDVRLRLEAETNRSFGARNPAQDTYFLHRYYLHADLKYRKLFRLFIEGVDARTEDRELPAIPFSENHFDLHQLFADLRLLGEEGPLTLRVGRQELLYGKQRLISPLDWANSRRRFDGAKLMYQSAQLDVDAFWTKPIVFRPDPFRGTWDPPIDEGLDRKPDHWREEQQFYGIYSSYKGIPNHVVDVYFLGLNDRGVLVNANGQRGDLSVYTLGSRFGGVSGNFDYDVEGAGQWGVWNGDEWHAWMVGSEAGYTFKQTAMTPRVGLGFDYATGDDTPRDNAHETFNQLFPLGHAWLGYMDLVARQNIIAPNVNFSFKPRREINVQLIWYHFWLDSNLDALYNAGGAPIRRNVSGSSGNGVGDELDLRITWNVDVHSTLMLGWSHLWPDNFINSSGRSRDADFLYLQYEFRF